LRFVATDNDSLLAYSKTSADGSNLLLTVVNLDPFHTQAGIVDVPIHEYGIAAGQPYQVHDLIADTRYTWRDWRNYVELNPFVTPAHIFRVHTNLNNERNYQRPV
jgi:starch synthase (maltosyl-transferring)